MISRTKRTLLTTAIAFGLPTAALAQAPAPSGVPGPPDEHMQALFTELQEIHQQLETIQIRALQDSALSAEQEQISEEIQLAMEVVDPMMRQRMERVGQLEGEAVAAQQDGDNARLNQIMSEAQQIQQHFMMVQESALTDPAIAARVADFQTRVEAKMKELDPAAEGLITRLQEIQTEIEAAMTGGGQ